MILITFFNWSIVTSSRGCAKFRFRTFDENDPFISNFIRMFLIEFSNFRFRSIFSIENALATFTRVIQIQNFIWTIGNLKIFPNFHSILTTQNLIYRKTSKTIKNVKNIEGELLVEKIFLAEKKTFLVEKEALAKKRYFWRKSRLWRKKNATFLTIFVKNFQWNTV